MFSKSCQRSVFVTLCAILVCCLLSACTSQAVATLPSSAEPAMLPLPALSTKPLSASGAAQEQVASKGDPELARYAPCVTCHNQHPLQVKMPHPLNPTCNECHRGSPNRIGCPSCHSMHSVEYHEPDPKLPCATCHS